MLDSALHRRRRMACRREMVVRGNASIPVRPSPGGVTVELLEGRRLLAAQPLADAAAEPAPFSARINFQPARRDLVEGYLPDSGQPFGDRGNGIEYGWI